MHVPPHSFRTAVPVSPSPLTVVHHVCTMQRTSTLTDRHLWQFPFITLAFEWREQAGISLAFREHGEQAEELQHCNHEDSFIVRWLFRVRRWSWLEGSGDPLTAAVCVFMWHIYISGHCFHVNALCLPFNYCLRPSVFHRHSFIS